MRILIDVNVLVALVYPENENHAPAVKWLDGVANDSVFVCRMTQNGLLRLLTLSGVMKDDVRTMGEAWRVYDRVMTDARFCFAPEPEGIEDLWRTLCPAQVIAPKKWMDAYLAAFAIASGMQFVTFDRGFRDFRGLNLHLLGAPAVHEQNADYAV